MLSINALNSCYVYTSQDIFGQLSMYLPLSALIVPPRGIQGRLYWIILFFFWSKILVWNILSSLFLTAEINKILTAFRKIVFYRILCCPYVRAMPFHVLGDNPSTTCSICVLISISRLQTLLNDTTWVLAFQRLMLLFTGKGIWNRITTHEKKRLSRKWANLVEYLL